MVKEIDGGTDTRWRRRCWTGDEVRQAGGGNNGGVSKVVLNEDCDYKWWGEEVEVMVLARA